MMIQYKYKISIYAVLTFLLCMVLTIAVSLSVKASVSTKTYTVKIYAGNVGTFSDKCKAALTAPNVQVSDTCIEMQLAADTALPVLPTNQSGYIEYHKENKGQYYILDGTFPFRDNSNGKVTRSEDVTVQYGKLTDGVEYTIKYVVQGAGTEIALPTIAYGEAGTEITAEAVDIAGYTRISELRKTIKLVKNGTNVIIFEYASNGGGTTYTETTSTEVIDGGITTEYVETEVPTYVVTATAGGGGAAGGGADDGAAADAAAETEDAGIEIPEGEVPLADTPDGAETNEENEKTKEYVIEDQQTPLSGQSEKAVSLWVWIAAIIGAVAVITTGTVIFVRIRLKK